MVNIESLNAFLELIRSIVLSFSLSIALFLIILSLSSAYRKKVSFKTGFIILLICTGIIIYGALFVLSKIFEIPYWSQDDFENWAAVVIEIGVAIFITGMIFLYDREHNKKIEEIQKKKREYGLQKIKLLLTLTKEEFQDKDYDDAKETFNEIISTLNIFSETLDIQESRQILELSEIGKIFCKYNGEHPVQSNRTMPFTTSIPANKSALFFKFDEVIGMISENESKS
ncbi:MAG: hypothetical protein AABX32_06815 [Nanoarchaeota archaeon]